MHVTYPRIKRAADGSGWECRASVNDDTFIGFGDSPKLAYRALFMFLLTSMGV